MKNDAARRFALPLRAEDSLVGDYNVISADRKIVAMNLTEAEAKELAAAHEMRGLLKEAIHAIGHKGQHYCNGCRATHDKIGALLASLEPKEGT